MIYANTKDKPSVMGFMLVTGDKKENVKCPGPRFHTWDFLQPEPIVGARYMKYAGWIILERLCDMILYFRPYCVVEIGAGESSKVLALAAERAGVTFHSVDVKPQKKAKYFHSHIYHNTTSEAFMKDFEDNPAIVLIDGDHHYEAAKKEFDFFFDKLVPGGVIFLHDTLAPAKELLAEAACGDVYKLRQELEKRTDEMDCFTWPYSADWMGLTMIIKKEKSRAYWEK